ncbi:kinase [Aeromonas veronii]
MNIVKCQTLDGQPVEFVHTNDPLSGLMKEVYFSPDRSYVVAFYKKELDAIGMMRLTKLVGEYRDRLYNSSSGHYWQNLFCWPDAIVQHEGRTGIRMPVYPDHFFFKHGSFDQDRLKLQGKDKEGKWFAANKPRKMLDSRELGDWLSYLRICLKLARAIRRLHLTGLAHSDLSYKNVLIDPVGTNVCVIDIDGLVVPNLFPPDVVGTPDFIAPEVIATNHLAKSDPDRVLPSRLTDLYALSVLIYMYLLHRHPLKDGKKIFDMDDDKKDDDLRMGQSALFIEHPTDHSNSIDCHKLEPGRLPWHNTQKRPYRLTGPYLSKLFDRAFIDSLHKPNQRPAATDWEHALVETMNLLLPCSNSQCEEKWFVFDSTQANHAVCPFCETCYDNEIPLFGDLMFWRGGQYHREQKEIVGWDGLSLYRWHINGLFGYDENTSEEDSKRVAYIQYYNHKWLLVNEAIADLTDVSNEKNPVPIGIGSYITLRNNLVLSFGKEHGARKARVSLISRR